jgi:formiminotetrahydrofolate cyclodeaminase
MSSLHIRSLGDTPSSIWSLTAAQVRDLTASLAPTPGGGSISIFTATLGLALVHKGASISLKRTGEDITRRDALVTLCGKVTSSIASMSTLADDDSQAFDSYLQARALPRATDDEKFHRASAMEAAVLQSTRIPLASAKEICAALQYAETAIDLAAHHLLTDIFGGVLLMQSSVRAVLLNVDANLSHLSDAATRSALQQQRTDLEHSSNTLCASIAHTYHARISAATNPSAAQ